jgi:hypothetical protein
MFTCVKCRQSFDIAVAADVEQTLESMAREATPRVREVFDFKTGDVRKQVLIETPGQWITAIQPLLAGVKKGQTYVFFDGVLLPYRHGPVKFKGLFREHDLPDLPHIAPPPLGDILTSPEYWKGEPKDKVLAELEQQMRARMDSAAKSQRPFWRRVLDRFS